MVECWKLEGESEMCQVLVSHCHSTSRHILMLCTGGTGKIPAQLIPLCWDWDLAYPSSDASPTFAGQPDLMYPDSAQYRHKPTIWFPFFSASEMQGWAWSICMGSTWRDKAGDWRAEARETSRAQEAKLCSSQCSVRQLSILIHRFN